MPYFSKIQKNAQLLSLFEEAAEVLQAVGIPASDKTERALAKMVMAFLSVAGVTKNWEEASDKRLLKTRDVINFINQYFEENISPGSYDDIRRKDLKLLVLAGLVLNSSDKPNAATNDPTRAYNLNSDFARLLHHFGKTTWQNKLEHFMAGRENLAETLKRNRGLGIVRAEILNGMVLGMTAGKHNELQKAVIEEFLTRFGKGCEVLYMGDTAQKLLYIQEEKLKSLHFFEISHEKLPDIIAFDEKRNWLFLIEAVHSSGPISEIRMLELKRLTKNCTAEIIFVTAFLTKSDFRKWANEIAWETEVWIAENPDHLIHFNGDKFLGPYQSETKK